jgi:hypothetical protein
VDFDELDETFTPSSVNAMTLSSPSLAARRALAKQEQPPAGALGLEHMMCRCPATAGAIVTPTNRSRHPWTAWRSARGGDPLIAGKVTIGRFAPMVTR